ncbi:MAG: sterol desaturase family protein [Deltaproteobacteria bacterium]|nr:MAG: sterol desaturase family protein [Deltaproteobacteria bacterium]
MDSHTTYTIGGLGMLVLFALDYKGSPEFRESFKKGVLRNRTVTYMIASLLVLIAMGSISKMVKAHVPDLMGISSIKALDYIGVFLFAELLNYVFHYVKHFGWFWSFHFQHHIDSKYTVLLTSYTHAGEVLISGTIMGVLMSVVGFSQEAINTYFLFYSLANTYQHSHANLSLGSLDWIIVSPRYHRIHHSKSYRANYGSTLTFWDIVFGTAIFPKRNEVVTDIGIHGNNEPFGFWEEFIYFAKSRKKEKVKISSEQLV